MRIKPESEAVTDGLIAHYRMNGGATDETGSHNASLNGATATTGVEGNSSGALDFSSGDSMDIGSPGFSKPIKTVAFWFKTTDTGSSWNNIVPWDTTNDAGTQSTRTELGGQAGRLYTRWITDPASDANSTSDGGAWSRSGSYNYNDGNWHFYVSTFDGDTINEYWDGELFTSSSGYNSSVADTLSDGGWSVSSSFPFEMDELRFYDRAITADEVSVLYNNTQGFTGLAKAKVDDSLNPTTTNTS